MAQVMDDAAISLEQEFITTENNAKSYPHFCSTGTSMPMLFMASRSTDDAVRHGYDRIPEAYYDHEGWYSRYKQNLSCLKTSRALHQDVLNRLETEIEKTSVNSYVVAPAYVKIYFRLAEEDPKKRLNRSAWYYTGGCVQHVECKNDFLVFVDGIHRDTLCVGKVNFSPSNNPELGEVKKIVPIEEKEIFQVSGRKCCNRVLIGTRQKNSVLLYFLKDIDEELSISECFNVQSCSTYTSFDLCPKARQFCVIDCEKQLAVWDICNREKPVVMSGQNKTDPESDWSNVVYNPDDPSYIFVTDHKSVNSYDTRTGEERKEFILHDMKNISPHEEISLSFASHCSTDGLYIATSERLLMVDMRSPNSPVQTWMHEFSNSSPPLFSSIIPQTANREIVCIANELGNIYLIDNLDDLTYPVREIPSVRNSMLLYQSKGLFLDPYINTRAMNNIVGLTCLRKSSEVHILSQTIKSDIFSQNFGNPYPDYAYSNFSSLGVHPECLHASGRWNMKRLFRSMKKTKRPLDESYSRKPQQQKWHFLLPDYSQYKDVLATILTDTWEFGRNDDEEDDKEEDEEEEDEEAEDDNLEIMHSDQETKQGDTNTHKVEEWLSSINK